MVTQPAVAIRPMAATDWPDVCAIYAQGIATGDATFATDPGDWPGFDVARLAAPRLVAASDGQAVLGWATLSGISDRCVYSGVAEASVYVGEGHRGRGIGHALLAALISQSEQAGLWTLQAGIFPENTGSLALFGALGFRTIGRRDKLGQGVDGRWRDVMFLERRSEVVSA